MSQKSETSGESHVHNCPRCGLWVHLSSPECPDMEPVELDCPDCQYEQTESDAEWFYRLRQWEKARGK